MVTKDQKFRAFDITLEITKEAAKGCGAQGRPELIFENTYKKIIEIMDEIHQGPD